MERTWKNIQFSRLQKSHKNNGFFEDWEPFGVWDFECCTFDLSDNSPYIYLAGRFSEKGEILAREIDQVFNCVWQSFFNV